MNRKSSNRLSNSVSITKDKNGFSLAMACIIALLAVIMVLMNQDAKREKAAAWYQANKERIKEYRAEINKKWREENREYVAAYRSAYDRQNVDRFTAAKRERYQKNPDSFVERNKRWYLSLSEDRRKAFDERRKEVGLEYRKKYAEQRSEAHKRWRAKQDPESLKERRRQHYEKNRVKYIQGANARRVLLTGTYTQADIEAMYKSQHGICLGCRKKLNGKYEIDHVMPLALDRSGDRLDNLQLLCKRCNRSKHALHPDVWAARIGRLFV